MKGRRNVKIFGGISLYGERNLPHPTPDRVNLCPKNFRGSVPVFLYGPARASLIMYGK